MMKNWDLLLVAGLMAVTENTVNAKDLNVYAEVRGNVYYQVSRSNGELRCYYRNGNSGSFNFFGSSSKNYDKYAECPPWGRGNPQYTIKLTLNGQTYLTDENTAVALGPHPSKGNICTDTPSWDDTKGLNCKDYENNGWCKNRGIVHGYEWMQNSRFNYPEKNCCVCGKKADICKDQAQCIGVDSASMCEDLKLKQICPFKCGDPRCKDPEKCRKYKLTPDLCKLAPIQQMCSIGCDNIGIETLPSAKQLTTLFEREATNPEIFHGPRNSNCRIINGQKDVPITDRPFQVWVESWVGCGGSLVHQNWVLTAGHCVTNLEGDKYPEFRVKAGSTDLRQGYDDRVVFPNDIKVHPDWTGNINEYGADLALMYIANPFQLSNTIQTIPMNDHASNLEGKIATISGWGKTEVGVLDKLSKTDMIIGKDTLDHAHNHMLGMPNSEGTGACSGDSGGPATVIDDDGSTLLVGVASYVFGKCGADVNNGCTPDSSAGYVDIYSYMDWIKQTIGEDSG